MESSDCRTKAKKGEKTLQKEEKEISTRVHLPDGKEIPKITQTQVIKFLDDKVQESYLQQMLNKTAAKVLLIVFPSVESLLWNVFGIYYKDKKIEKKNLSLDEINVINKEKPFQPIVLEKKDAVGYRYLNEKVKKLKEKEWILALAITMNLTDGNDLTTLLQKRTHLAFISIDVWEKQ